MIELRKGIINTNDEICIAEEQSKIRQQRRRGSVGFSISNNNSSSVAAVPLSVVGKARRRSSSNIRRKSVYNNTSVVMKAQSILAAQYKDYSTKQQLRLLDKLIDFSPSRIVVIDDNFRL